MKCLKCGTDLTGNDRFCPNCGEKAGDALPSVSPKESLVDKFKSKCMAFWGGIDLFCKIETVSIIVTVLLFLIAVCCGKGMPIFLSILQLAGLIFALLLHTKRIKSEKGWIKYILLSIAILFVFLNLFSYSWFNEKAEETVWEANTPCSATDCIGKNKEDVKKDFANAGFYNIVEEKIEDIDITSSEEYGNVESVSINGDSDFFGNAEFKNTSKVVIRYHDFKPISVPFSAREAKEMDAVVVQTAFEKCGFAEVELDQVYDLDPDMTEAKFETRVLIDGEDDFTGNAAFSPNAKVRIITRRPYLKHSLKVVVDFVPNLILDTYDVKLELSEETENLTHGQDAQFEYRLKEGTYTITFRSSVSDVVKGTAQIDLTGDTEVAYQINCHSDRIDVDTLYIENKGAVGENEAMVPLAAQDCKYKNYNEIAQQFSDAGFTNISYAVLYDIVWGWTSEGEVENVAIAGKTDFQRGDIFEKDATLVITYHMKEESNPDNIVETKPFTEQVDEGALFYSCNDYETAKKGNTGVFAYKNEGGSYDVYWIIDFDEGYVYWFTDGNGETSCDKVKIVSGDLNDRVVITWQDGGEEWSWYLKFENPNSPKILVVVDHNGFETKFSPISLQKAKNVRKKKTIIGDVEASITVENNADFSSLMQLKDQTDAETIKRFVEKYRGKNIEFDGCVGVLMAHEDYKTRFDILLSGGDFDAERVYGPFFAFENVNYYDMNVRGTDSVAAGMNFRIVATIEGFSEEGIYIRLKPVSMTAR